MFSLVRLVKFWGHLHGEALNNDETWSLLLSKHPECDCSSVPTLPPVDIGIPPDFNLTAILMSFLKLTAAGLSGIRIQHIIDTSEVLQQTPILQSLKGVINLLAAGEVC